MSDEIKALVAKLTAKQFTGRRTLGGGTISHDGTSTMWGNEPIMELRNPDGPEAAAALTAQADEIERLSATFKRVQGAAKTIMHHEGEELARLRKQAQEHHLAIRTLDSEREANALLTDEIERLRARLEITDEITERYDGIACRDETIRLLEQKIAALKAAQEVKAIESGEHLKEGM